MNVKQHKGEIYGGSAMALGFHLRGGGGGDGEGGMSIGREIGKDLRGGGKTVEVDVARGAGREG